MTGIILSGGKSTRMGTNKAFVMVNGERMIDKTVRIFKEIFPEVIIVTNSPLDYLDLGIQIVTDVVKGKSSLGGIYTGLVHASHEHAFVAPCDMPFLNKDFIRYMTGSVANYDIVVPSAKEGIQPLHAIYGRRCLPVIKKLIAADNLKITGFYKGFRVLTIDQDAIAPFDKEGRLFMNLNSPDDLQSLT